MKQVNDFKNPVMDVSEVFAFPYMSNVLVKYYFNDK